MNIHRKFAHSIRIICYVVSYFNHLIGYRKSAAQLFNPINKLHAFTSEVNAFPFLPTLLLALMFQYLHWRVDEAISESHTQVPPNHCNGPRSGRNHLIIETEQQKKKKHGTSCGPHCVHVIDKTIQFSISTLSYDRLWLKIKDPFRLLICFGLRRLNLQRQHKTQI